MATEGERTQYQVAYFPPTSSRDKTKTFENEVDAALFFDEAKEEGYMPILSKRTVTTTEWSMVKNSVEWPVQS